MELEQRLCNKSTFQQAKVHVCCLRREIMTASVQRHRRVCPEMQRGAYNGFEMLLTSKIIDCNGRIVGRRLTSAPSSADSMTVPYLTA
ncbi:hypothetical protein V9T40_006458 [Parthenolecanium corni]|uniref:Uncharacterized protein n=1 Tax=Parthenolecanium corni TaxID=536013 RepID=A0AAN9TKU1_9HEMI